MAAHYLSLLTVRRSAGLDIGHFSSFTIDANGGIASWRPETVEANGRCRRDGCTPAVACRARKSVMALTTSAPLQGEIGKHMLSGSFHMGAASDVLRQLSSAPQL